LGVNVEDIVVELVGDGDANDGLLLVLVLVVTLLGERRVNVVLR
jgi:hypothetical protein